MPTPDPAVAGITAALAAAGREFGAALAEAGYRMVATTALGQVVAGLPDAAGGMIEAMPEHQVDQLATHALTLFEIAVAHTPDGRIVDEHMRKLPVPNALSWHLAHAYLHALDRRDLVMLRFISQASRTNLYDMRDAAYRLMTSIDEHLAQDPA